MHLLRALRMFLCTLALPVGLGLLIVGALLFYAAIIALWLGFAYLTSLLWPVVLVAMGCEWVRLCWVGTGKRA